MYKMVADILRNNIIKEEPLLKGNQRKHSGRFKSDMIMYVYFIADLKLIRDMFSS